MKKYTGRGSVSVPRRIIAFEICVILHITRKPNLIVFIYPFKIFLSSQQAYLLVDFFKTLVYSSGRFQDINRCFFLADTPQKVDFV